MTFDNASALVIGIASYPHVGKLPSTILKDAQDLYNLLVDPQFGGYLPDRVQLLQDIAATKTGIEQALRRLGTTSSPDSTVFIFVAGHGAHVDSGPQAGDYVLPVDVAGTSPEALARTAISWADFAALINAIPARKLVVTLDCGHVAGSGEPNAIFDGMAKPGLSERFYETLKRGRGRVMVAASRSGETSSILPGTANSLFIRHLLAGLQGGAIGSGGVIRIVDLFNYVEPRVIGDQPDQHPVFKAEFEENFPIACYLGGKTPASPTSNPPSDGYIYDVFISYRQQEPDKSWVRKILVPRLEAAALKVCIDYRDFHLGAPVVKEMERGVVQSRHTVAVLSPAYLKSNFTDFEQVLATQLGLEKTRRHLLAILREDCDPGLAIRARLWLDMTNDSEFETSIARLIYELNLPS